MPISAGTVQAKITADLSGFKASMQGMYKEGVNAAGRIESRFNKLNVNADPIVAGFKRSEKSIASFRLAMVNSQKILKAENVSLAIVEQGLNDLAQAYRNVKTASARQSIATQSAELQKLRADLMGAGKGMDKFKGSAGGSTQAVINFNRVIQDAPYGIIGVANNLDPLAQSFNTLKATTGSTMGAIKTLLKSAFTGPGALITAVSLASAAAVFFTQKMRGVGQGASEVKEQIKAASEEVKGLSDNFASLAGFSLVQKAEQDVSTIKQAIGLADDLKEAENRLSLAQAGTVGLSGEQRKAQERLIKSRQDEVNNLKELISWMGHEDASLDELNKRLSIAESRVKSLNNAQSDQAKLAKFVDDAQANAAQTLDAYSVGIKGSGTNILSMADAMKVQIDTFRAAANAGNTDLIPVIKALDKEYRSLTDAINASRPTVKIDVPKDKVLDNLKEIDQAIFDSFQTIKPFDVVLRPKIEAPSIEAFSGEMRKNFDGSFAFVGDEMANIESLIAGFKLNIPEKMFPPGSLGAVQERLATLKTALLSATDPAEIERLNKAIAALQAQMSGVNPTLNVMKGLANQFTDSFGQGMANVIVQGEKLEDIMSNIGKLFLSSAIQTAIKLLLMGPTGTSGLFGSLFGGVFHSGGIVQGKGEKLALVRGGEGVFTQSQMKAMGSMPQSQSGISEYQIQRAFEKAMSNYVRSVPDRAIFEMGQRGAYG